MAVKDFLAKVKSKQKTFNEARTSKRKGMVEVEPGRYIVRFQSMELDTGDHGEDTDIPFVQINTVVVQSVNEDDIGSMIRYREYIKAMSGVTKEKKKWAITEADQFANICYALQSFGVETDELEVSDLPKLAEDLQESQPACKVTVKDQKKNDYMKVLFGKPVDDDNLPSVEDVMEEDDDDDDADDSDDEGDDAETDSDDADDSDDDSDDDDDDAELIPPKKGEKVMAIPEGVRGKAMKYTVVSVNKSKEVCTLKRDKDGKEFKDQAWGCIEG